MTSQLRSLTIVGLVLAGAAAGAAGVVVAHGQVAIQPVPVVPPVVLSGADIGFRMSARKGSTPVGNLVVKVDGEWREVEFSYGLKPLTSK
jgi:hypothetical protein